MVLDIIIKKIALGKLKEDEEDILEIKKRD
jgi:hypothetical protein